MLIFLDSRAPDQARYQLQKVGEVVSFETSGICYPAISGHPDIFMFQHQSGLIVAPNIPSKYLDILRFYRVPFQMGHLPVGSDYPETARYNALSTSAGILHNAKITDEAIKTLNDSFIHCNQGYVRCTAVQIGELMLTSDKAIERLLLSKSLKVLFVDPQNIVLQDFSHGFFGGCCGLWEKNLYFCGNLRTFNDFETIENQIYSQNFQISELFPGSPMDVGGIFFIPI